MFLAKVLPNLWQRQLEKPLLLSIVHTFYYFSLKLDWKNVNQTRNLWGPVSGNLFFNSQNRLILNNPGICFVPQKLSTEVQCKTPWHTILWQRKYSWVGNYSVPSAVLLSPEPLADIWLRRSPRIIFSAKLKFQNDVHINGTPIKMSPIFSLILNGCYKGQHSFICTVKFDVSQVLIGGLWSYALGHI